jgi:RND family efflux transporter MFP subunit
MRWPVRIPALLALMTALACGDRDAPVEPEIRPAPPPTNAVGPEPESAGEHVGVVVAAESFDVTATQSGAVLEMGVRIGDRVEPEDLIARLDVLPVRESIAIVRAQVAGARAQLSQAEHDHDQAVDRLERRKGLADSISIEDIRAAEFEVKKARAERDRAAAEVARQQAELEKLRRQRAETEIRSPVAGTVSMRYIDPGTVVAPGTQIVRLVTSDALWVRFAVPADQAGDLARGKRVQARVAGLEAPIPAVVRQVAPELDPASQMILVEAELQPDPEVRQHLHSGLAAWVR